jgi:Pectate lyase superfamily protein
LKSLSQTCKLSRSMTVCISTIPKLKELTLEDISKLPQEIIPDTSPCVIVQGYYEPGDGGGGHFFWDGSFCVDLSMFPKGEDFGTIIKPNSITDYSISGRWRRIFDGPLSSKWFGARGDFNPETGKGGESDTEAIQAAFDVVKYTGIPLYLPPGKYKVTTPLKYHSSNLNADYQSKIDTEVPYHKSQQGLHFFGAGMQKSILYNEINNPNNKPPGGPAISITRDSKDTRTFQQTGLIRDLKITSKSVTDGSIGIDMQATWGYTLERIRIRDMGSHGLILRNQFWNGVTSDFDACAYVHLDNVISEFNGGWGIIVSTAVYNVSTAFTHIERCIIDGNKGGGIQWTGQQGLIERCGIHANGVYPMDSTAGRSVPTPVSGAHGILIKNVHAPSFGLHIDGCEFQGNSQIQIAVQYGSNIKISQNIFSADDLDKRFSFPEIDIQVGDANLGDIDLSSTPKISELDFDGRTPTRALTSEESEGDILKIKGALAPKQSLIFSFLAEGKKWLVVNYADRPILLTDGVSPPITVASNTEKTIGVVTKVDKVYLREFRPDLVNGCVIEDNRIRASWNTKKLIEVITDGRSTMVPGGWGEIGSIMPPHTVVKVNSNAVGTIIRNWWIFSLPNDDQHKLIDAAEYDPYTHQRLPIAPSIYPGKTHIKTDFQREGLDGGHVLLPFASRQEDISEDLIYIPDTSNWSSYRFRIIGNTNTFTLGNPTVRSIGSPLFFEFVNGRNVEVTVNFDCDYSVGGNIILPPASVVTNNPKCLPSPTTVTGILLFEEGNKWTLYSPWTCNGVPLSIHELATRTPNQGRTSILMKDKTRELAAEEYNKRIIDISGTLTSDQEIIFPLKDGSEWLVRNNTSGGKTITVKGTTGTGVGISAGDVKNVFSDGINFYG